MCAGAQMAGKRDAAKEAALLKWVFAVIGETVPNKSFEDTLKDGVVLCKCAQRSLFTVY